MSHHVAHPNPASEQMPTFGFLLHEVARLLRRTFEQKSGETGLTRSQFQAVATLADNEGINQTTLADRLEIETVTLVRILDGLEERGLVERRADPGDRRARLLYLTSAAAPMLTAMRLIGDAARAEALAGISADDQAQLCRTLMRMKSNLTASIRFPGGPIDTEHKSNPKAATLKETATNEAQYG